MEVPLQVLVAEKSPTLSRLLVQLLEQSNFSVEVATTVDDAIKVVEQKQPDVVLSSVSRFDGEQLCKRLRKADRTLPICLIYPPQHSDDAEPRARMLGADLVLIGPVQQAALVSAVRLLIRMRRVGRELAAARESALEHVGALPDLAALKRILAMEVKKSRRYRYPTSFLLLELDGAEQRAKVLDRTERARHVGLAMAEMTQALRDIDLCVHAGNDKFIVFLPHTAYDGARIVASRLHARIRGMADLRLTASVGVASYDGQGQVSFGGLLKEATLALKRARQAGGDRVELAEPKKPDRVFIA